MNAALDGAERQNAKTAVAEIPAILVFKLFLPKLKLHNHKVA
jgi:hypothetical protein